MKKIDSKYKSFPFWSWNDKLNKDELVRQIEWMNEVGIGGFFMHARGGLKTKYLGKEWFECIEACSKRASELGMEAYAYDENGWPSGFVGGKLLEDIENHDRYLTYKIGEYDKDALVSYDTRTRALKRVSEGKECLNIYEHYSASTVDILNPEVVDKFIALTHEEYAKRDKHGLKGFFTDEPQYYRWGTPYTKMLPEYFKNNYGEDILDGLGLLFVEKRGYRDFRYKFWRAMQDLMLNSFGKKIYDWCSERGYKLTGHYIEENGLCAQMLCCGGIMPFYEYEHIPGIDYLGRWVDSGISARQVSSVASQLGKSQVLTETFAACSWHITPMELKRLAEAQYVGGVNLMCQHLLPYAEHGQRKRDYPAHFSSVNPWIRKGFGDFNYYFSALGQMLANSEELVSVGVLHPIRSAYFDYKRFPERDYHNLAKLEGSFSRLQNDLNTLGIGYHLLDETIMARHARVEGKELVVGKCRYSTVIIPKIYTMDKTTNALLEQYVENGGKILIYDTLPRYLEGKRHTYTYLKSNTSLNMIAEESPVKIKNNNGVRIAYRRESDGREFIYAVNVGDEQTVEISMDNVSAFSSYDIMSDTYEVIPNTIHFDFADAYILYPTSDTPKQKAPLDQIRLGNTFEVVGEVENYLTLDLCSYSLDGKTYEGPFYHMCVLDRLLNERYKGDLYLKYEPIIDTLPSKCELLCELEAEVYVNGIRVEPSRRYTYEVATVGYNVADKLVLGKNEIILKLSYYQGDNVYLALFGDGVTEGLKNCLAFDTEIEPIYLRGDFGVYGTFERGKDDSLVLGEGFKIGEQKRTISDLIREGYPFLAGEISLKQKIFVENTNAELVIDKPFQLIDVSVNGKDVGRMMLKKRLDLTPYLKKGENELILTLTVSNRNLYGPFHTIQQESGWTSPDSFERFGSWTPDGKSKDYVDKYAFVKTII